MIEKVLVLQKAVLFSNGREVFQGLQKELKNPEDLFSGLTYLARNTCEENLFYKQLIPYVFFRKQDKILCYQRTKLAGEERLHEKYSIGFGGHMNDGDQDLSAAIYRELLEEVNLSGCSPALPDLRIFGYLNDDSNLVGQVHFGLVFESDIYDGTPASNDEGLINLSWKTKDELLELDIENWSKILVENL